MTVRLCSFHFLYMVYLKFQHDADVTATTLGINSVFDYETGMPDENFM